MGKPLGPQRWLLPYADVATLLFALFAYQYFLVVREPDPVAPGVSVAAPQSATPEPTSSESQTPSPSPPRPSPVLSDGVLRLRQALSDVDPRGFEVREEVGRVVLVLADSPVFFASASCELQPEARALLQRLTPVVKASGTRVRIDGHSDSQAITGTRYRNNWELSLNRAAAVAEYLLSRGCPPESLSLMGLGDCRPVADNGTPEGRRRNRRVEITFEFGHENESQSLLTF